MPDVRPRDRPPAAARARQDGGLRGADRERGHARDRLGHRERLVDVVSAGTTRDTRPARSASAAVSVRPVRIMSIARGDPDRAGQSLRPAGARHDAQADLGLAEASRRPRR